jgi:Zn-dependent peptidase ImmA (M78 family)/transcriptional regulator with XRE-family HTH domain
MAEDFGHVLGDRIRRARKRLGISQTELARICNFSAHQTIVQIEKGQREVKAWELAALAKALHVRISDLVLASSEEAEPIILWRECPEEGKELIEADFRKHCMDYSTLEKLAGEDVGRDLPSVNVGTTKEDFSYRAAAELADVARRNFDLGSMPAGSLEGTLENSYRIKIWYRDLSSKGSAASTKGTFGCGILINSKEPPWRRNFSFAHELFHLLTWDIFPPESLSDKALFDKVESFANSFASSLLLPSDTVKVAFEKHIQNKKVTYTDFISIARQFGVSTEALMYRLLILGCISKQVVEQLKADSAFRDLDRSTMSANWWEPPPIPERFVRLAFTAYTKGNLSRSKLAEYLNTSIAALTDTLMEYGLDDREDYEAKMLNARC